MYEANRKNGGRMGPLKSGGPAPPLLDSTDMVINIWKWVKIWGGPNW